MVLSFLCRPFLSPSFRLLLLRVRFFKVKFGGRTLSPTEWPSKRAITSALSPSLSSQSIHLFCLLRYAYERAKIVHTAGIVQFLPISSFSKRVPPHLEPSLPF